MAAFKSPQPLIKRHVTLEPKSIAGCKGRTSPPPDFPLLVVLLLDRSLLAAGLRKSVELM